MTQARNYRPIAAFVTLALLINATASFLAHHHFEPGKQEVVAYAACFDLIVTVPAIYYLLVVRRCMQSVASLFGLFLISAVRASFLFPSVIHGQLVLLAAEVGIGLFLCIRIRQGLGAARMLDGQTDPYIRMQAACKELFFLEVLANLLASELLVFYYAFFSWRSPPASPNDWKTFSTGKKSGFPMLLTGVACLVLIEIPLMHVLIARWSRSAAWIVTGLGIYSFVWVLGLSRSLTLRPVVVSPTTLELYKGFLWRVHVSLAEVASVRRGAIASLGEYQSFLDLSLGGPPDIIVELAQPATAEGPFGIRKRINAVGLSIDEAQRFESTINAEISKHTQASRQSVDNPE